MSISAMTLAMYHSKATYSTRLVLIAIANFEGEHGAYPSHETIGRLAGGLNRRTVQRAIDDLVELGELTEVKRDGITNLYHVAIRCSDGCDGTTQHRVAKRGGLQTAGGPETAGGGGVQTAGGAVSRPPEPLSNPKITVRETQLPDDWEPDESLLELFRTKWVDIDPKYHVEQFKLYYLAKGTKHKRWDLTFHRWMNSEQAKAATMPWKAGAGNSAAAKRRKESELARTNDYLNEMREMEKHAAPAPKCEHGENLALCKTCIRN